MGATVFRPADDSLSRQRWDFTPTVSPHSGFGLILSRYSIERRKSLRGRFRGADVADRWQAMDERPYASGLPRPTSIPDDVVSEAWDQIGMTTYIGWRTDEHALPDIQPRSAE